MPPPMASSAHSSTSSTSPTPTSPTRPSRLRGLTYLRNNLNTHLHGSSSPKTSDTLQRERSADSYVTAPSGENVPPVPQQSGSEVDDQVTQSASPLSSSSELVLPDRSMTRNRTASASAGPTPAPIVTDNLTRSIPTRVNTMEEVGSTADTRSNAASSRSTAVSGSLPNSTSNKKTMPSICFIPHIETRANRPSLQFPAQSRTLKADDSVVHMGRYSERGSPAISTAADSDTPIGFKSKVVSRRHCEFSFTKGQWYVKDVGSSSGTFLNHVRLTPPGEESTPHDIRDGDVLQLGIDFKGGEEHIFRCVKMRIECNRDWQKTRNKFNTSAHNSLLNGTKGKKSSSSTKLECSICLGPVWPTQATFYSPCGHAWHYKCISSCLFGPNYPNFICPNCRSVTDLEAEPDEDDDAPTPTELSGETLTEGRAGGEQGETQTAVDDGTEHEVVSDDGHRDSPLVADVNHDEEQRRRSADIERWVDTTYDAPGGLTTLFNPPNPFANPDRTPARRPRVQVTRPPLTEDELTIRMPAPRPSNYMYEVLSPSRARPPSFSPMLERAMEARRASAPHAPSEAGSSTNNDEGGPMRSPFSSFDNMPRSPLSKTQSMIAIATGREEPFDVSARPGDETELPMAFHQLFPREVLTRGGRVDRLAAHLATVPWTRTVGPRNA
ncbi:hypothetical protein LTR09_009871 [Extremus antarcticus]|uniref:FHA domain-containing protein n=1 Tax=Extremus antarcticus TaxID=702011 RepID=A0AAJ0D838_9PEZI|nr:hypothetical protein LTR09_009871 [Extremus antarcticus]